MSNTLNKLASSWTAACPGASMSRISMPGAYFQAPGGRLRMWQGVDLRDLRVEQRIQDDQGRSVFEHLIEDLSVPAPATAHTGATAKGGVSGPYPWRRPV
ncbi:hypothetical protein [Actinomadura formosensis]|uniref:hypothetical protein n=2 Tax=Actinomadura formosensis TaxID=60706 RepID=UPI001041196A|nr:hypothetical protein [Actinomadura formosensis]